MSLGASRFNDGDLVWVWDFSRSLRKWSATCVLVVDATCSEILIDGEVCEDGPWFETEQECSDAYKNSEWESCETKQKVVERRTNEA